MGQCFSTNLVPLYYHQIGLLTYYQLSALTKLTQGATYEAYLSNNDVSCPSAGPNDKCIFYCDKKESKESLPHQFSCGIVSQCEIHCEQKKCFAKGIIDARFVSGDLTVIGTGDQCYKEAEVNVPNTGSAYFSESHKSFRSMIVNAGTNTQNIIIDCTVSTGDECKGLSVNAQSAQFLEIIVGANSELYGEGAPAHIYCPQNSNYNGPEPAPCIFDLTGGGLLYYTYIHAKNGIPADVYIKTGPVRMQEIRIICDNGQSANNGNSWDTSSVCWNSPKPTANPTAKPAPNPTDKATPKPTDKPTTRKPTVNPITDEPTTAKPTPLIPTTASPVTATPTRKPTVAPITVTPTTATPTPSVVNTAAPIKSSTSVGNTAAPVTSATQDECYTSCEAEAYDAKHCEAENIGIVCTDANNECHAQCVITRDIDIAKEQFDNEDYIFIYKQLSALTPEERYTAYCGAGTCADAAKHTTTKAVSTKHSNTAYLTNHSDEFVIPGYIGDTGEKDADPALIIGLICGALILFICCFVCIQLWRRYKRKSIEPKGFSEEMNLQSIEDEILSGHFELKGNKLVELKGAGTRWDHYQIDEDKEMDTDLDYGLSAPPPRMRSTRDDELKSLPKAHNVVELKSLTAASCVATPYGCLACFCSVHIIMTLFGIYMGLQPVCLSFNFSDFKVVNSEISDNQYQYILAQSTAFGALGSSLSLRRRLSGGRRQLLYSKYGMALYSKQDYYYRAIAQDSMTVFYYSKKSDNILSNKLLQMVHLIEEGIKSYPGYWNHSLIYEVSDAKVKSIFGYTGRQLFLSASPGSFLNYIYPSTIEGNYFYDGNGDSLTLVNGDIGDTIQSLNREYFGMVDITDFFDFSFNFVNVSSKYLASVYPFSIVNMYDTELELFNWVASYKVNFFDKLDSRLSSYIGTAVVDTRFYILNNELRDYLNEDLKLAITSLLIIYVVLYLYCRSFYITTLGILGVCLSFIPCFAIYRMVWAKSFNIINLVSVWVILGIGCDDICVFISSYRRAPLESLHGEAIPNHLRLAFAYREAGSAMFVTSFTTSFSFLSLCLSTINPLPQFGWFLGSLVITNFILVMTWFPVVLQSYVWFVMGAIQYNFHISSCTKWLAVAVPLPSANTTTTDDKEGKTQQQQQQQRMSSIWQRQSVMAVLSENKLYPHDVDKRYRQQSKMFAVPSAQQRPSAWFNDDNDIDNDDWRRKSVKKIIKNNKYSGFEAETKFGDCTNLYFILMRRGLGIALIAFVVGLTVIFCITATQLKLAEETVVLLPDYTNWGQVNTAFKHLNIDPDEYSGYSSSSGSSSGSAAVTIGTNRPTRSPTAPSISTAKPTRSPITRYPTRSPTTPYPTMNPTTAYPTTSWPTFEPTISNYPSETPTKRPTTAVPIDPSYKCTNDGYDLVCNVDEFINNNATTTLQRQQIALVFEAGGLYNAFNVSWSDDIIACRYPNNHSLFYDEYAYISPYGYDVKWCIFDASPFPESQPIFSIETPYSSLMVTDWYRVSLWLYYSSKWNLIPNKKGDLWYNYSLDILGIGGDGGDTLSVDESVTINLLFGTFASTEYTTDCDGQITSGQVIFDSNFNIYAFSAQKRWNELCSALKNIDDDIMYRRDNDQEICFSFSFNQFLSNSSFGPQKAMPNDETLSQSNFNSLLIHFISQTSAVLYSESLIGLDPRMYRTWFGTATDDEWYSNNASIVWIQQTVRTQINKHWNGHKMWHYYEKWQKWMDQFNANSPKQFKGIQTSSSYIRMEVEVAFINGFIQSVGYTLLLCSIVMIFFTQNLYLVLLVCLYILLICIFVVGIFGAFGWPFGIIEVISVPTVVGLTIDYALHITHAYIHSPFPDRSSRAKSAVNDLGSSVFASAITTISSMFILYFAAIIIFSDLGWVVGSTTTFAVALALLVCPSCLMYTGPEYNQCHLTWFLHKNGCTIKGYTFCQNKWYPINKKKQSSKIHDGDSTTTKPHQIQLALSPKESKEDSFTAESPIMQNNPLQYNIKISQYEEE